MPSIRIHQHIEVRADTPDPCQCANNARYAPGLIYGGQAVRQAQESSRHKLNQRTPGLCGVCRGCRRECMVKLIQSPSFSTLSAGRDATFTVLSCFKLPPRSLQQDIPILPLVRLEAACTSDSSLPEGTTCKLNLPCLPAMSACHGCSIGSVKPVHGRLWQLLRFPCCLHCPRT